MSSLDIFKKLGKGGVGFPFKNDSGMRSGNGDFEFGESPSYIPQIINKIGDRNGITHDGLTATSNGTDMYLDTGYAPNGNTVWIVQGRFKNTGYQYFGEFDSANSRRLAIGSSAGVISYGSGSLVSTTIPTDTELHTIIVSATGKLWYLDGIVDISTVEKVRAIIDNIPPSDDNATGFTGSANSSLHLGGASVNGAVPAFFSAFEHFNSMIFEYDGVTDPVLQKAIAFESETGDYEVDMVDGTTYKWNGTTTGLRTNNTAKRLINGSKYGPTIDEVGYSEGGTSIIERVIGGDMNTPGDWDITGDVVIAGGVATFTADGITNHFLQQNNDVVLDNKYILEYEIISNTLVDPIFGLSSISIFGSQLLDNSVGIHSIELEANNAAYGWDLRFYVGTTSTSGQLVLDNVSLKQVVPTTTLVPAKLNTDMTFSKTLDALGNTLENVGSIKHNWNVQDSSVLTPNGIDTAVNIPFESRDTLDISMKTEGYINIGASVGLFNAYTTDRAALRCYVAASNFLTVRVKLQDLSYASATYATVPFVPGGINEYSVQVDKLAGKVTINGEVTNFGQPLAESFSQCNLFQGIATTPFDGKIHNFSIADVFDSNMSETNGNILFNKIDGGNLGVITGTGPFWGSSDYQDNSNMKNGFNFGGIVEDELIVNGGFVDNSGWIFTDNAYIDLTENVGVLGIQVASTPRLRQDILTIDEEYTTTFDVTAMGGDSLALYYQTNLIANITEVGTYTVSGVSAGVAFQFLGINPTGDGIRVDNVSCKLSYPETVRVPAVNSTTDAIGNPLLIEGGKLNNSENTIDWSGGDETKPFWHQIAERATFDGVTHYINTGLSIGSNDFKVTSTLSWDTFGTRSLMDARDGTSDGIVVFSDSTGVIKMKINATLYTSILKYSINNLHCLEIKKAGDVYILKVDGEEFLNITDATPFDITGNLILFTNYLASSTFFDGDVISAQVDINGEEVRNYIPQPVHGMVDLYGNNNTGVAPTYGNYNTASPTDLTAYVQAYAIYNSLYGRPYEDWKYTCDTSGRLVIESTQAYGLWEVEMTQSSGVNNTYHSIISDNKLSFGTGGEGYMLYINTSGALGLYKNGVNSGIIIVTANGVAVAGVKYTIKVVRNSFTDEYVTGPIGTFGMFAKGGSYGSGYTLLGIATENTLTTSNYQVIDIRAGDEIGNIRTDDYNLKPLAYEVLAGAFTPTNKYQDRLVLGNKILCNVDDEKMREYVKVVGDSIQDLYIPFFDSEGNQLYVDDGAGGTEPYLVINPD